MTGRTIPRRRPPVASAAGGVMAAISLALALALALGAPAGGAGAATGSGPVTVLYAGSLTDVMENSIGPAFQSATGYTFNGMSAGSTAIVTEVKGGEVKGDVFVSASPDADAKLEGAGNGDWVDWYVEFGTTPLEIGYNPASRFAHQLETEPWYEVVTLPGFLLGRTDPVTDPKGALAVKAVKAAAAAHHDPALLKILRTTAGVFPEQTLVGRLQAGQLDAGFFYAAEAKASGIPAVTLPHLDLSATYTATVLRGSPDVAAARAFVAFLEGPTGRHLLAEAGIEAIRPPKFVGTGVPSTVSGAAGSQ